LERLSTFGGYLSILRELRKEKGGVVVLSGGDMFQGTLESNPNEGAAVIEAYNELGYTAAAIGNHEFDFGPAGPEATPTKPGDDPQGALRARAAQATFPFLAANMRHAETAAAVDWENVKESILVDAGAIRVGVIGIATESTPHTTISKNVEGLSFTGIADAIVVHAKKLRDEGAEVVIVAAHAGASCKDLSDPLDTSSCRDDEIFAAADALPRGLVDVIIGGHTHAGVAHFRNGVAVIESFARGRAFGRVDLEILRDQDSIRVTPRIHQPRQICEDGDGPCVGGTYEGREVKGNDVVHALVAKRQLAAEDARKRSLGVSLQEAIHRSYDSESALGNLVADWMRAARPAADIAITNGGGLRANLPAGDLTYGALFEVLPFDNRFARVKMTGSDLRRLILRNLTAGRGIFSVSGIRARARCKDGAIDLELRRKNGRLVKDDTPIAVATSDFLAWGGDGAIGRLGLPASAVTIEDGLPIRDVLAAYLEKKGGRIKASKGKPRLDYPGKRPVRCPD